MILGTVTEINANGGLKILLDGEATATTKTYKYLSSYVPKVNDRVLIEEIGDSYVILGSLISASADAGRANSLVPYSGTYSKIEFTYFNSNLWCKIDGGTQFALAKQS